LTALGTCLWPPLVS